MNGMGGWEELVAGQGSVDHELDLPGDHVVLVAAQVYPGLGGHLVDERLDLGVEVGGRVVHDLDQT